MAELRNNNNKVGYFGMVFGKPGSGKTSLLSTIKNSFWMGNEINREFNLYGFEPVKDYKEFSKQIDELTKNIIDSKKGFDNIDTIIIDNLTDLERMCIKGFCGDKNLSTWGGGFGAGYNEAESQMRQLVEKLKTLQVDQGKNIILTCHSTERNQIDQVTEDGFVQYVPFLEKKSLLPFENHSDFIFHLHRKTIKEGSKKYNSRVLLTSFSAGTYAKKKSFIDLPSELIYNEKNKDTLWADIVKKFSKEETKDGSLDFKSLYNKANNITGNTLPPFDTLKPTKPVIKRLETIIGKGGK